VAKASRCRGAGQGGWGRIRPLPNSRRWAGLEKPDSSCPASGTAGPCAPCGARWC